MLPVSEAPSRQKDGQVFDGMAAAVAEVASQEHGRPVEQTGIVLFRLAQFGEQMLIGKVAASTK